jgi:hypothetical protein
VPQVDCVVFLVVPIQVIPHVLHCATTMTIGATRKPCGQHRTDCFRRMENVLDGRTEKIQRPRLQLMVSVCYSDCYFYFGIFSCFLFGIWNLYFVFLYFELGTAQNCCLLFFVRSVWLVFVRAGPGAHPLFCFAVVYFHCFSVPLFLLTIQAPSFLKVHCDSRTTVDLRDPIFNRARKSMPIVWGSKTIMKFVPYQIVNFYMDPYVSCLGPKQMFTLPCFCLF